MGWATPYIAKLQRGETVSFRPVGRSMEPLIFSGDLVIVVPIGDKLPNKHASIVQGDIVLCRVEGKEYLHLVKQVDGRKPQAMDFLIGNNKGRINGWTPASEVFGKVVSSQP
jgi:SOS-response transcriptional repressor LexA